MKKLLNMIILIIEIMMHKYYNKAINYIKYHTHKEILIDILIQNSNYHKYKF